ncbi:RDD family protein [Brevibacillus ruminantium]|uniref:RDD family protein n=1 Tax=Brevibacillus ruminantium TaxID=2950604 RepID=A0ABY4WQK9_9BACL|nr:RDD family protein [Brevibacillus ruminantium]USG67699.1 RDD family protein [Brevibacillus ruminantium]
MNEQHISNQLEREMAIVTPEHVQLRFQTAGLGSRAAAQLIDTGLLLLVNLTVFLIVGIVIFGNEPLFFQETENYALAIILIVLFLLNFGYFFFWEYFRAGQTPGKRWMKIRVIQENGQSLTFLSAVIRNLFRIIDSMPTGYMLGSLVSFFHPRDKRIGDLVAGTIVVVESGSARGKASGKWSRKLEKWRENAPVVFLNERQKQAITREDWNLLDTFVQRIPGLSETKRIELALQIVRRICTRLDWPQRQAAEDHAVGFLLQVHEQLEHEWKIGR